jgi:hypothetical protein
MNQEYLARALTKTVVLILFWVVFLFSMYLRSELSMLSILFDLGKSMVVSGLAWVFLSVILDTLVKSMMDSAREANADRFRGGLSYHITPPTPEELEWQKRFNQDNKS